MQRLLPVLRALQDMSQGQFDTQGKMIIYKRLMHAGKLLKAKITDIEVKGSFTKISIGIYLVNF